MTAERMAKVWIAYGRRYCDLSWQADRRNLPGSAAVLLSEAQRASAAARALERIA